MANLSDLFGGSSGGGGFAIDEARYFNRTKSLTIEDGQTYLRSGFLSNDLATYPDAQKNTKLSNGTYTNKSYDAGTGQGSFFKPDGTTLYTIESGNIRQHALTTAWDLDTASFVTNLSVSAKESSPTGLHFSNDGTNLYIVGFSNSVHQYTLSTAWDISTAVFLQIYSIAANVSFAQFILFNEDGTRMYFATYGEVFYQYDLSTAWDISTSVFDGEVAPSLNGANSNYSGAVFINNGTGMFLCSNQGDVIYQVELGTPWNILSIVFPNPIDSLSVTSQASSPTDVFFNLESRDLYVLNSNSIIYQYDVEITIGAETAHAFGDVNQYIRIG